MCVYWGFIETEFTANTGCILPYDFFFREFLKKLNFTVHVNTGRTAFTPKQEINYLSKQRMKAAYPSRTKNNSSACEKRGDFLYGTVHCIHVSEHCKCPGLTKPDNIQSL